MPAALRPARIGSTPYSGPTSTTNDPFLFNIPSRSSSSLLILAPFHQPASHILHARHGAHMLVVLPILALEWTQRSSSCGFPIDEPGRRAGLERRSCHGRRGGTDRQKPEIARGREKNMSQSSSILSPLLQLSAGSILNHISFTGASSCHFVSDLRSGSPDHVSYSRHYHFLTRVLGTRLAVALCRLPAAPTPGPAAQFVS